VQQTQLEISSSSSSEDDEDKVIEMEETTREIE
jgi:hypothetical protein